MRKAQATALVLLLPLQLAPNVVGGPPLCGYVVLAGGSGSHVAANELSRWLSAAGRCTVPVVASAAQLQVSVLLGGPPHQQGESFCLRAEETPVGVSYSITAGTERGAIYGAHELLNRVVGVEFLAQNVTKVPQLLQMPQLPQLDVTSSPAFEFRSIGDASLLHTPAGAELSLSMRDNSIDWEQDPKPAGGIYYANPPGGVHTAFRLIPPAVHQAAHPEWFGGFVRDATGKLVATQLCWSEPGLVSALIEAVKTDLRFGVNRNTTVVSVSQNDGGTFCNSSNEMAVIRAESSPAGPLLIAVNAVADAIAAEFPRVLVDTLAYMFTLPPPRRTQPRPNVVVRIGTMGANFRLPLNATGNSAATRSAFVGWGKIAAGRIWAWDYTVNFPNYVSPWPNHRVLGANLRFMRSVGVAGVYMQGDGYAVGSDLSELKTWLLGKLLWDPSLDDVALTQHFLREFYGPVVAPFIAEYMQLFVDAAANTSTMLQPEDNCLPGPAACDGKMPYLAAETLLRSADIFRRATVALGTNASSGRGDSWGREQWPLRLKVAELPTLYVILLRWQYVREWAVAHHRTWPLDSENLTVVYESFAATYRQHGMDRGVWCAPTPTCNATCRCNCRTAPCVDNALGEWEGAGLPWLKKQIGA